MPRTNARFGALPPFPLSEMKAIRRRIEAEGGDVIDLGAGDAPLDAPRMAIDKLHEVAGDKAHSRYAFQVGLPSFREAIADFMHRRFGVSTHGRVDAWTHQRVDASTRRRLSVSTGRRCNGSSRRRVDARTPCRWEPLSGSVNTTHVKFLCVALGLDKLSDGQATKRSYALSTTFSQRSFDSTDTITFALTRIR